MKHIRNLMATAIMLTLVISAFVGSAITASASDTGNSTGTATLSAGALTVNSVADFGFSGTLIAAQQTLTSSFNVNVADPTETAAGWHLQASITALTTSGSVVLGTNPKITAATPTAVNGTVPTNSISSYGAGIGLSTTAVSIFGANASTGMGQSNIAFNTSLVIPATATSGSYTATVTVTIVSGP